MKTIKLKSGIEIIVDDEDYDRVREYKWHKHSYRGYTYIARKISIENKRTSLKLSRFILKVTNPKLEVRFKDSNYLNHQKENLEIYDKSKVAQKARTGLDYEKRSENLAKQKVSNKKYKNKYRGVSFNKRENKFTAQFNYLGKSYHIGYFTDEIEAAIEWNKKYLEVVGKGAYQNPV